MEQVLLLLIFLPLVGALITAFTGNAAKHVAMVFAVASLAIAAVIEINKYTIIRRRCLPPS